MITIKKSNIADLGIFSDKKYCKDEKICIIFVNKNQTLVGRYTNHSDNPNTVIMKEGNNLYLVGLRDIKKDEELLCDYKNLLKYYPEYEKQIKF